MPDIKRLVDRFNFAVTTAKNVQTVIIVVGIIVAILVALGARWRTPTWLTLPAAFLLGISFGVFFGMAAIRRRGRELLAQTGFKVIEYQMEYAIGADPLRHRCERTYQLEATHDGASIFLFEYNWSGRGEISTKVTSPDHRLIGDDISNGRVERCAIIALGKTYDRGEKVRVVVEQELYDEAKRFSHFISKVIKFPMRKATLIVDLGNIKFDPRLEAEICKLGRHATWVNDRNLGDRVVHVGNKWTVELENPPVGKQLRVEWRWLSPYEGGSSL